ncbi:MAG: 4-hydroxy-tetrahydrodipicolinate reductase [Bacteroidota bacterium]|nr:4-hydroxy-tetrahydrodipicolinate reductase [Bacteroidota bacterium]
MKIAIIGYGKMGKIVESMAKNMGHDIHIVIDKNNAEDIKSQQFASADVAIEFTEPDAAVTNFYDSFSQQVPVVSGTTGWMDKYDDVVNACSQADTAFFYASNFSIGVNVLFEMNKKLANIMQQFSQYQPLISETHHIHKKDAPSGTAIHLAEDLISAHSQIKSWKKESSENNNDLPVKSIREGEIFGEHSIVYESDVDILELTHKAKNRKGFALGAVLAAEFIQNKKGIFSMKDMLAF